MNESQELPINLLKVPGYFYFDHEGVTNKLNSFGKLFFNISKQYDFDIALLSFRNNLLKIHESFFENFEIKKGILRDIKYYITRHSQIFAGNSQLVSLKYFVDHGESIP